MRYFLALLLTLLAAGPACALTVDLLSSSYTYDLYLETHYPNSAPDNLSLRSEGTSSISVDTGFSFYDGFDTDVFGSPFLLRTSSDSVEFLPDIFPNDFISGAGYAFISGTWAFKPAENANDLVFNLSSDGFDAHYISIFDCTDDAYILDVAWKGILSEDYIFSNIGDKWNSSAGFSSSTPSNVGLDFTFLNDHTYYLNMGIITNSGGDSTLSEISANVSVPEPNMLILLCFGVTAMVSIKKTSKISKN